MTAVKYMFAYRRPAEAARAEQPSPAEMEQIYARWTAWKDQFSQEIVDLGDGLKPAGKVVRPQATTDGPFVEAKEVLGGFSIVQATSLERAMEVARACPFLAMPGASIELREMMGY